MFTKAKFLMKGKKTTPDSFEKCVFEMKSIMPLKQLRMLSLPSTSLLEMF